MAAKLFTVEVDGYGSMIATIGSRESARVSVIGDSTASHITAARELVALVFQDLHAQGYAHAHDNVPVEELQRAAE
jgi:hypothetical protein